MKITNEQASIYCQQNPTKKRKKWAGTRFYMPVSYCRLALHLTFVLCSFLDIGATRAEGIFVDVDTISALVEKAVEAVRMKPAL